MNIVSFYTSFGWITSYEENNLITSIKFGKGKNIGSSVLLKKLKKQIIEYTKGKENNLQLNLIFKGQFYKKKFGKN